MDIRTYLKHAVDQGWWASGSDPRSDDLAKIRISPSGTTATAEYNPILDIQGNFTFELVDGVWTIDTFGLDVGLDEYYRDEAIELDITPEDVILEELEEASGKKVRKDIWTRPY